MGEPCLDVVRIRDPQDDFNSKLYMLAHPIEFNGDHIKIAARFEQKAKDHDLNFVFSLVVADEISGTKLNQKSPKKNTSRVIQNQ